MNNSLLSKVLTIDISKTSKLILVTMLTFEGKNDWSVCDLSNLLNLEAKTIRVSLREMLRLAFVQFTGKSEQQAHLYAINVMTLLRLSEANDLMQRTDLRQIERQSQQGRLTRRKKQQP